MGSTLNGKNCSWGEQFFPFRVDPNLNRGGVKIKIGRVASPESVPIHLNPIALRKANIECNFGLSECSRVKLSCQTSR